MVTCQELESGGLAFTVRPNCALGWRHLKRLFVFLAGCVAAVSVYFASKGAWLVLPFAGLEVLVIGIGVYSSALSSARREVIEIDGNDLRVLRGRRTVAEVSCFSRHWSRIALQQDPRGWYPSRLFLRCHNRGIEVGRALVESERLELAEMLRARLSFQPAPNLSEPFPLPDGLDTVSQKI